ncbi:hypothetical protein Voja6_00033 [Pseudomonas phage vB_PpuM-Voja-6]
MLIKLPHKVYEGQDAITPQGVVVKVVDYVIKKSVVAIVKVKPYVYGTGSSSAPDYQFFPDTRTEEYAPDELTFLLPGTGEAYTLPNDYEV